MTDDTGRGRHRIMGYLTLEPGRVTQTILCPSCMVTRRGGVPSPDDEEVTHWVVTRLSDLGVDPRCERCEAVIV